MGRKKRKIEKPWCWYCNREFDDDKILIQHQKAKHFKCHICHKKLFSGPGLSIHCMQVHKETIDKIPGALPNRDNVQMEIYGMQGIPYGATRGVSAPDDESKRARVDDMAGMMPPFPPFPMPGGMPPLPGGMPPMPPGPPQGFMPPMPPMPFPGGGPMPPSLPQMPPGGPPQRHSQFFPAPPRSQGNFNDGYNYEGNGDYPPEPRQQRRSRFDQGPPSDMHGNSRTPPSRDSYFAQGHEAGYRDDFRPPRGEPYPQSGGGYDNNGYPKEEPYYPPDAKYVPPVAAAAPPVVAPASKLGAKTKIVHPDDYTISLEERRALEELRYR